MYPDNNQGYSNAYGQQPYGVPYQQQPCQQQQFRQGIRVGYSPRINTPEFQQRLQKTKMSINGCTIPFMVAPIVFMPIYAYVTEEMPVMHGLLIGVAVTLIMVLLFVITSLKTKHEKEWEGTVIDKRIKREYHEGRSRNHDEYWEPCYYVYIRTDSGKVHKIKEEDRKVMAYNYFNIGDRVRFHAKTGLAFPYEKYDKSRDDRIVCAFCRRPTDINATHCSHCHSPLLN